MVVKLGVLADTVIIAFVSLWIVRKASPSSNAFALATYCVNPWFAVACAALAEDCADDAADCADGSVAVPAVLA